MKNCCIGIDIGGTKTAVAIFDESMNMLSKRNFPTASAPGCRELTGKVLEICRELARETGTELSGLRSLGIASPGPLDPSSGTIIDVHTLGYKNEPILSYIREQTSVPCALVKDTNAAVYYESILGKGKDKSIVLYVTVSTGIGSGLCIDRKIILGESGCAGELGHMVVVPGGRLCGCGSHGCLEAYASGTAISRIASEKLGRSVDAKEVFALARAKDSIAQDVVSDAGRLIGYAAGCVCQTLDPGIIIFGGSVTRDFDVLGPYIEVGMDNALEKISVRHTVTALSDPDGNQTVCGAALFGMHYAV
ncbi:MAG: ROK family protein [Eubacteriales bacterium]